MKVDVLEHLVFSEALFRDKNGGALKSVKEEGGEPVAFFALELPFILNRSLLSNDAFENAFLNLLQEPVAGQPIQNKRADL